MAARPPLPVPYGLSREYEDFLTKGKATTKHIEQLRSRSAPIFTAAISSHAQNRKLPISTASAASFAPNRPCRVSKNRKSGIGSQRNMTPPLSKPKLVRSEKRFKSSVFIPEALICPPILRQQIRTSVGARLDARLGTCHESPITLDSDSEEPVKPIKPDAALRDASGSNSITVRPFTSNPDAVHVPYLLPASVTPAIRKSATRWRPSPHAIPQTKKETVTASDKTCRVHIESRPTNMRDARSSQLFSRIKPSTPGPWHYRSLHPQLKNRPQDTNDGHPKTTELVDMTLMDIEDFDLRSKVAHLMAVAPALPIRDLYHLVVDSQSRMSKAIKRASRMSGAPHQVSKTAISNHSDTKETMVKIDPNDTTFEWDNDEPTEPIPKTLRSTKQKPSKLARKVYKRMRDEY